MCNTTGNSDVPLVSVVVPVYNRRQLIGRAVESILGQDWPRLELVVVDDGSTDGTGEFLQQTHGDRVRVVRQENAGPSAGRNTGYRHATGEFLTALDSDDLMLEGSIRARAEALIKAPDAYIAYGRCLREKESGRISAAALPPEDDPDAWPRGDALEAYATKPFCHHTDLMFRRALLPPKGELYDPLTRNHEDYLMVLALLCRGRCVPCYRFTTHLRAVAGKGRQRLAHETVLAQGLAPLDRALRDPVLAERMQPVLGKARARFLTGMAGAARSLRRGHEYRQHVRRARAEDPEAVRGLKHLRRWLLSYFMLK